MAARTLLASLLCSLALLACDSDAAEVECDDDGACWALASEWPEWLQHADTIGTLVESGQLEEEPGGCWAHAESDALFCEVELDGVPLLGRPVEELDLTPASCAKGWETATSLGDCWAIVDDVAVMIR